MTSIDDDSPWSLETLRVYLETRVDAEHELTQQRFQDRDKAVEAALLSAERAVAAALTAAKEAVAKAEVAQEKRLDSVNEFRAQLADLIRTLMPRAEAEQRIATNGDKIDTLDARIDKTEARIDRTEGKSTGLSTAWAVAIGAVGLVASIVIVLVTLRG